MAPASFILAWITFDWLPTALICELATKNLDFCLRSWTNCLARILQTCLFPSLAARFISISSCFSCFSKSLLLLSISRWARRRSRLWLRIFSILYSKRNKNNNGQSIANHFSKISHNDLPSAEGPRKKFIILLGNFIFSK